MKKIIKLTESDLTRIVKRVLMETSVVNPDKSYTLEADYILLPDTDQTDFFPEIKKLKIKKGTKITFDEYNGYDFDVYSIDKNGTETKLKEQGSTSCDWDMVGYSEIRSDGNTINSKSFIGGNFIKNTQKLFCDGNKLKSFEDVKKTYDFLHAKPPYIKNLYGGIYNITSENKSEVGNDMSKILGQSVEVHNLEDIKKYGEVTFSLKGTDIWVYTEYDKPNNEMCRGCMFRRNYYKNGVNYTWDDLGDKEISNKNYDKSYDYTKIVENGKTKYYIGRKDSQKINPSSQTYGSSDDYYMSEIKPGTKTYLAVKSKVFGD